MCGRNAWQREGWIVFGRATNETEKRGTFVAQRSRRGLARVRLRRRLLVRLVDELQDALEERVGVERRVGRKASGCSFGRMLRVTARAVAS